MRKFQLLSLFVPACTSTYRMENNKSSIMPVHPKRSASARAQAHLLNVHLAETHLSVPHGGNNEITVTYIYKLLVNKSGAEWMKGICHIWSRGRHFSPSMPGDRYLKLSPQKRPPGRNLGEHRSVRRSGTASRGTALLVFGLRMRSSQELNFSPYAWKKNLHASTKCIALVSGSSTCG